MRETREEERKRQQKLARERLEAARKRREEGLEDVIEEEDIFVDMEDTISLQEAIARDMDRKHLHERQLFLQVSFLILLNSV